MSFTPDTLLRQWQTLRLIPRHPARVSAGELRNRLTDEGFSVGKRTVERDLLALSRVFPLVADERAKPFGWSWQKDAPSFDLPGVAPSEALTLLMAREHLRPVLPASILSQMQPYFRMAEQKLGAMEQRGEHATNPGAWMARVRIIPGTQALIPPSIDQQVQATVHEALLAGRQCLLAYQARASAEAEQYPVHPLGLVQRGLVLYLVCSIRDYPNIRLLALHRIRRAEALDDEVRPPAGFDLDAYLASGAFGWGPGEFTRLEAAFTPETGAHLFETPLSDDQSVATLPDGRLKVTAEVRLTQQLVWWLLGFGEAVEVLAPPDLRAKLAAQAGAMAALYAGKSNES
jgi:predicted DNA-binding transcriptional regulator YafY